MTELAKDAIASGATQRWRAKLFAVVSFASLSAAPAFADRAAADAACNASAVRAFDEQAQLLTLLRGPNPSASDNTAAFWASAHLPMRGIWPGASQSRLRAAPTWRRSSIA
jgi:hypothetical protein